MCSSPKSSGSARPRTPITKGVFAELSNASKQSFTSIANAADEKRQLRKQRLFEVKQQVNRRAFDINKTKGKVQSPNSYFSWLFRPIRFSQLLKLSNN